jgi:large subunit ribosomal protein L21e
MPKMSHGKKANTRKLLTKKKSERNVNMVSRLLQEFQDGASVSIIIEPSVESGMPFRRFNGLQGTVTGRQGRCYLVDVKCGSKVKTVLANPAHLKRL